MIPIIIMLTSLLLDGIISNYLPYLVNDLSILTPLFTLTSIVIIFPFYKKKYSEYFIVSIVSGLLYDLMYTNLFLTNASLFLMISLVVKYIYKNFNLNNLKILFYITLVICLYETSLAISFLVFNVVPITFNSLLYKIINSLFLNLLYGQLLFNLIKIIPRKYTRLKIN